MEYTRRCTGCGDMKEFNELRGCQKCKRLFCWDCGTQTRWGLLCKGCAKEAGEAKPKP